MIAETDDERIVREFSLLIDAFEPSLISVRLIFFCLPKIQLFAQVMIRISSKFSGQSGTSGEAFGFYYIRKVILILEALE